MSQPNPHLTRRLRPLYIAAFFQGFVFWYAVEKLFMKSIGINDAGIAIIVVAFTLVMMLANLPFGILADRWSRRNVLMVATLFLVAASVIDGFSTGFSGILLGSCLWGTYFACYTGTYDSVVYDTLIEETGSAKKFELYYGRLQFYDGVALVVSSLLCSLIIHFFKLQMAYFVTVPFSCLSLVALWRFKEPQLHKSSQKTLLGAHIRETLHTVLRRKEVLWLVVSLVLLSATSRLLLEFDQLWLIALALPLFLYGPVNALLLAGYGVSGLTANLMKDRRFIITSCSVVATLASICLLYHWLSLTILAIFIILGTTLALEVIINRWLHDTLPSKVRASASSTVATIGYGVFLPVGLLFGFASQHASIFRASWIVIGACALLVLSVTMASRLLRPLPDNQA